MRNIIKSAFIVGLLSTSIIVMADTPKKAGSGSASGSAAGSAKGSAAGSAAGSAKGSAAGSGSAKKK